MLCARPMAQNVYTSVASAGVVHAQIITGRLAKLPLGPSKRVLHLAELTGPSTAGGALSRQSMMLSSEGEQPVCGWVDFAASAAEVRDFISIKKGYELRFRKPFDVEELEYREWLQKLLSVFKELGVVCDVTGDEVASAVTEPAVSRPAHQEDEAPQRSLVPMLVLSGLIVVLLMTLVLLLRR